MAKSAEGPTGLPVLSLLCSAEYPTRFWYTEDLDTSFVGGSWLIFFVPLDPEILFRQNNDRENIANYYSTKHTFFGGRGGGYAGSLQLLRLFSSCRRWGCSLHEARGLLLAVPCLVVSWASRALGLQSTGSGVAALLIPHVGSSQIRDGTCVSYTGRQICYHWPTKEAPTIVY